MNHHRRPATWLGAALGSLCALLVLALGAHASDHRGALTEEFHQTYAITSDGRIELDNINGPVHISSWDRNEVKVDAIKYADTKERLDEAKIEIDSGKDYLSDPHQVSESQQQLELGLAQQSRQRGIHADRSPHREAGRNQADQRRTRHHRSLR